MLVAVAVAATGVVVFGLSELAAVLIMGRVLSGLGFGAMAQSRQLFVARGVPLLFRGRVNSGMGGIHRLALAVGPLIGGGVADRWGFRPDSCSPVSMAAGMAFWVLPGGKADTAVAVDTRPSPLARRCGVIVAGSCASRPDVHSGRCEGRYVIIPLVMIVSALLAEIGALLAVGTVVDFVVFPLSGAVMDRFGRLYSIVPPSPSWRSDLCSSASPTAQPALRSPACSSAVGTAHLRAVLTLGADSVSEERRAPTWPDSTWCQSGPLRRPSGGRHVAEFAGLNASAVVLGDPDRRGGLDRVGDR